MANAGRRYSRRGASARILMLTALVQSLSGSISSGADYLWNNAAGGNFGSSSNWLIWNGSAWVTTGSTPGSSDNVYFDGMNSGASASSNVARNVNNQYTRGNSTLDFGDGSFFGFYNANYLGVSNGAEQRLVDGTFNIGYADVRSFYYSYLTVTGPNTVANIGTMRTAEAEAFNGAAAGRLTVADGAKVYANHLYHQRYNSSGYTDYAWHVHGTNSLLQVTGSSVNFYNAGGSAWVQNGGVMDLGNASGATMNAVALTNGVFIANAFTANSAFGHGVLATNFGVSSVANYHVGYSPDGAVNIASNFNVRHLSGYVHSNALSKFAGTVTLAGGSVITDFGNSVHGLELTGSGQLSGYGTVYLGNSGLLGSAGTSLNSTGGVLTVVQNGNTTFSGSLTGAGTIDKNGTGILTWQGANTQTFGGTFRVNAGTFHLSGNGSLGGPIVVNGGTLQVDPAHRIADTSSLTMNGGTFFLNSFNETIGRLSGGAGTLNLGVGNLVVTQSSNGGFAGVIQGSSSAIFTKSGAGDLDLVGTSHNTMSGLYRVNQGNLFLHKAGAAAIMGNAEVNGGNLWVWRSNQILDSANVHINSGTFTIGDGTTVVAERINRLSGAGTVDIRANGALVIDNAVSTSYSGTFLGTSSSVLTKTGTGYLDVVGSTSTTFAGLTRVEGGILYLNRSSGVQSFRNVEVNGGSLWIYSSNQIADDAGVHINSGIFTIGSLASVSETFASLTGGGTVDLRPLGAGSASLAVNNAANIVYAGTITGAGNFHKMGAGQLLFSGSANYTGGTLVSGGILRGTVNSLQGNVLNNAVVYFDQGFNGTYAGNHSGSGELWQSMNPGNVLTLTGNNSHSGRTLVSTGEHRAGSNGAFSANSIYELGNNASAVLNVNGRSVTIRGLQGGGISGGAVNVGNGFLTINQSANTTFAGTISGTGGIYKTGSGTLNLTGSGPFNGSIGIDGGRLALNGSTLAAINVYSGGALAGTGTASVVNVEGGVLAPGNSAGNLYIDTLNMEFGTYQWELAALTESGSGTNFDRLTVDAAATLGGASRLEVAFIGSASNPNAGDPFWGANRQWTVLSAGALSGMFGGVMNGQWATGSFSLSSVGNQVMLNWNFAPVPEPSTFALIGAAGTVVVLRRRLKPAGPRSK
jgi:fibronectin-binding autotransporter adhesin